MAQDVEKTPSFQESKWIDEYLIRFDAAEAARHSGYAEGTAQEAYRWVVPGDKYFKPHVFEEVKRRLRRLTAKHGITTKRIIDEYVRIALANWEDFTVVNPDTGERYIDNLKRVPRRKLAAISEIEQVEVIDKEGRVHRKIKIKMHNKVQALDSLARYKRIFDDDPLPPPYLQDNRTLEGHVVAAAVTTESAAQRYQRLISRVEPEA